MLKNASMVVFYYSFLKTSWRERWAVVKVKDRPKDRQSCSHEIGIADLLSQFFMKIRIAILILAIGVMPCILMTYFSQKIEQRVQWLIELDFLRFRKFASQFFFSVRGNEQLIILISFIKSASNCNQFLTARLFWFNH